jgi:hypothetical protein
MNEDLLLSRIHAAPADKFMREVQRLMAKGEAEAFKFKDGLLVRNGRIYVPSHERL